MCWAVLKAARQLDYRQESFELTCFSRWKIWREPPCLPISLCSRMGPDSFSSACFHFVLARFDQVFSPLITWNYVDQPASTKSTPQKTSCKFAIVPLTMMSSASGARERSSVSTVPACCAFAWCTSTNATPAISDHRSRCKPALDCTYAARAVWSRLSDGLKAAFSRGLPEKIFPSYVPKARPAGEVLYGA